MIVYIFIRIHCLGKNLPSLYLAFWPGPIDGLIRILLAILLAPYYS